MKKIYGIFIGIASVMIVYAIGLFLLQEKFIYHPDDYYTSPKEAGLNEFAENPLQMSDGQTIMTWLAKGEADKPVILFFHGNCAQIAEFAPHLISLIKQGYPVLMAEYRGFGGTKGELNQASMYADALRVYDWLKENGHDKVIVFGYSLGTAAASVVAAERKPDGVILLSPFYSMRSLVAEKPVPFAKWVLKDSYDSALKLKNADVPLLIIHGAMDPLIPYHHSLQLMENAGSKNKTLRLLPFDTHQSVFYDEHSIPFILEWLKNF